MFTPIRRVASAAHFAAVLVLVAPQVRAEPIVGLTTTNKLVIFDTGSPGTVFGTAPVTGLAAGQTLVGIDFRPVDRALVGLAHNGTQGQVYGLNPLTGAATALGAAFALTGSNFGVDFNPVPNALRIVSDDGSNVRITAGGTGVVNNDTALNPVGPNTGVVAVAYSNNVPGGVGGQTTLYDINATLGNLYTQGTVNFPPGTSPNLGTLFLVGSLGAGAPLTGNIGFDISGTTGAAFVSIGNDLRNINLGTGAVGPSLGTIPGDPIRGIAISFQQLIPEPGTMLLLGLGLVGMVGYGRRLKRAA